MNAHKELKIYYMDTDSMYIHINDYERYLSDVQDGLGGGKNDYGSGHGIVYARFIGSKQKLCYSVDLKSGIVKKHVTFKGVQTSQFQKINCETTQAIFNQSKISVDHHVWKRSAANGIQVNTPEQPITTIAN